MKTRLLRHEISASQPAFRFAAASRSSNVQLAGMALFDTADSEELGAPSSSPGLPGKRKLSGDVGEKKEDSLGQTSIFASTSAPFTSNDASEARPIPHLESAMARIGPILHLIS